MIHKKISPFIHLYFQVIKWLPICHEGSKTQHFLNSFPKNKLSAYQMYTVLYKVGVFGIHLLYAVSLTGTLFLANEWESEQIKFVVTVLQFFLFGYTFAFTISVNGNLESQNLTRMMMRWDRILFGSFRPLYLNMMHFLS